MIITWKVDDGYVGHGPHQTEVDDEEIQQCESAEEAVSLVEDAIISDFQERVNWASENFDSKVMELWENGHRK